ncbi:MAG: thiamine transport system substrate-binding protein [Candidatus Cloacimonadota bacterium]|nr:thiamine transport system substrate-binding protein [Candidatus Cloacimonadota bacterium]
MMRFLALLLIFALIMACSSEEPQQPEPVTPPSETLRIYALESFRSSKLEAALIPDFEKEYSCKVDLSLFASREELLAAILAKPDTVDLVLGIDNALAAAHDLQDYFKEHNPIHYQELIRDGIADENYCLIPYAYSYIGLLYNPQIVDQAPQSFGELQDPIYANQLALLNPQISAWGQTFLHYVVAVFNEEGLAPLFRAIRKNVCRSYSSSATALNALQNGECGMIFGMFSAAAWLHEQQPLLTPPIQMLLFQEGSYLYTENVAQFKGSKQDKLTNAFIKYLLGETAQSRILYSSGLLPSNPKVILPQSFSNLTFSAFPQNERLPQKLILTNNENWLQIWRRILGDFAR